MRVREPFHRGLTEQSPCPIPTTVESPLLHFPPWVVNTPLIIFVVANRSRLTLPSSVMAAAGRRIAYEFACASVANDFALTPQNRTLFANVSIEDNADTNPEGFRNTLIHLANKMIGKTPSEAELRVMTELYTAVLNDGNPESALPEHCWASELLPGQTGPFTAIEADPNFNVRAWMTVVSYLAMDSQFLFEW